MVQHSKGSVRKSSWRNTSRRHRRRRSIELKPIPKAGVVPSPSGILALGHLIDVFYKCDTVACMEMGPSCGRGGNETEDDDDHAEEEDSNMVETRDEGEHRPERKERKGSSKRDFQENRMDFTIDGVPMTIGDEEDHDDDISMDLTSDDDESSAMAKDNSAARFATRRAALKAAATSKNKIAETKQSGRTQRNADMAKEHSTSSIQANKEAEEAEMARAAQIVSFEEATDDVPFDERSKSSHHARMTQGVEMIAPSTQESSTRSNRSIGRSLKNARKKTGQSAKRLGNAAGKSIRMAGKSLVHSKSIILNKGHFSNHTPSTKKMMGARNARRSARSASPTMRDALTDSQRRTGSGVDPCTTA